MESSSHDLWPDDIEITGDFDTPLRLLREQASLLGKRTKNIVQGSVVSTRDDSSFEITEELEDTNFGVRHRFALVAPALGHYTYTLFVLTHDVVQLYPVKVLWENEVNVVKSKDELESLLKRIFSAEKTKRIIHSLIAQSTVA